MVQHSKPPSPTLTHCGERVSSVLIGHLVTRLEVEAGKRGGFLSTSEIRTLSEAFLTEEMPHFHSTFQRSFDECTERREEEKWSGIRKQPFDRIMTKKFAHLFPSRKGDDGGEGVLSRRVIPGFNVAINKMIGPMLYEQCQGKTRAIMDRHRSKHGGYDWNRIYTDPDCQSLTRDILVVVAHYFSEFDRRRNWFIELVNSNLAKAVGEDELHASWHLTQHGFAEMMRALFADLEASLTQDSDKLMARYGEYTITALESFLKRLQTEL